MQLKLKQLKRFVVIDCVFRYALVVLDDLRLEVVKRKVRFSCLQTIAFPGIHCFSR